MLDKNSIAQLSQLKQDILASKDLGEGTVVGTSGRYGFVKLDDGRTAFLNPEKMQRLLPGDRVRVNVVKNAKEQLEAELEKVLEAGLSRFVGQYKIKGNAHFVLPLEKGVSRWIFLPPQNRMKCKEGDYVLAEITRHPFADGKAAAKILNHIGAEGSNFLQHNIVIAKYGIARYWSKDALNQAKACAEADIDERLADLTELPLVTIDAPTTKDMDDAVCAEADAAGGWTLWVAIADPASYLTPGSFIAKSARYFAQTVYLPGRVLPMLPEGLTTGAFSLQPEQPRSSLVARLTIDSAGQITDYQFQMAKIRSRQKLSYQQVSEFLDGDRAALKKVDEANAEGEAEAEAERVAQSLECLAKLADARFAYRQTQHFISDDQADFDWTLNKQGQIESIAKRLRTRAHRLVEEAMVATNICAGEFLAKHSAGVYSTQIGFRPERLGEVKALLREELGEDVADDNIEQPAGFIELMQMIKNSAQHRHLLAPLRRFMQTVELADQPLPHLGLGVMHYAPVTSPIRRYVDLCNHWTIQQILKQGKAQSQPAKLLEQLSQSLENSRLAARELEQTLMCEYLSTRLQETGTGVIRIVTQQGFGVRFRETGVEGFVQIPKQVTKTFDAKRMTLTVAGTCFALDQQVEVRVASVDRDKRRVKLELTDAPWNGASSDPAPTAEPVSSEAAD